MTTQLNQPKRGPKKVLNALERAVHSAMTQPTWTIRPSKDVRKMLAKVLEEYGGDRNSWIEECVRAGLTERYGGKTTADLSRLRKGGFKQ